MPQIPRYSRQVGYEPAQQPLVQPGFFTEQYRAMAQAGEAGSQLANLIAAMNKQNEARKLMDAKADFELQATDITSNYNNDDWAVKTFGEDYTNMASEQMREYDTLGESIAAKKLTGLSENGRAAWVAWMNATKANLTGQANRRQYQFHEERMKLSFFRNIEAEKTKVAQGLITPNEAMTQIEQYLKQQPQGNQLQGEVWMRTTRGQIEAAADERQKAILAALDHQDTMALISAVENGTMTVDQANSKQAKDPRYVGRNEALNAEQAKVKEAGAAFKEQDTIAVNELTGTIAGFLANHEPSKALDVLQQSDNIDLLNKVDPGLIVQWQKSAYAEADRLAKGLPIVTVITARDDLNQQAADVGRGWIPRDEALGNLRSARLGTLDDKGNLIYSYTKTVGGEKRIYSSTTPQIDDADYQSLSTKLTTEYDSSITSVLNNRRFRAREQILGAEIAGLDLSNSTDAAFALSFMKGRGENKEDLNYRLERYNKLVDEFDNWWAKSDNQERVAKQGVGIFKDYADERRKETVLEVEQEIAIAKKEGRSPNPYKEKEPQNKATEQKLPRISTRAEVERLAPGTRFMDQNGKIWTRN